MTKIGGEGREDFGSGDSAPTTHLGRPDRLPSAPGFYGQLPEDLGDVDLSPVEMMFWLYTPIKRAGRDGYEVPDNLRQFWPIIYAAIHREGDCRGRFVYLTAKTLWVEGAYIGNRPGWHSDGFGSDDVNYIWYDRAPTEFIEDSFDLPDDCDHAMEIMTERATQTDIVTFPAKHLLRLTPSCVHRSPVQFAAGMRTFVKVSISTERYNLEGNSRNHHLGETWPLLPREDVRNHPVRADFVTATTLPLPRHRASERPGALNMETPK